MTVTASPPWMLYPRDVLTPIAQRAARLVCARAPDGTGTEGKLYLVGSPGEGKSAFLKSLGAAAKAASVVIRSATGDGATIAIARNAGAAGVDLTPRAWIPKVVEILSRDDHKGSFAIVFVDEISSAEGSEIFSLLQDGIAGDYQIPEEIQRRILWVTAGNDPARSRAARPLPAPLSNRLVHVAWPTETYAEGAEVADREAAGLAPYPPVAPINLPRPIDGSLELRWAAEVWASWARTPTAHPPWAQASPSLCPTDDEAQGRPWPSRRSWTIARRILAAAKIAGIPHTDPAVAIAVEGCVGAIGAAFVASIPEDSAPRAWGVADVINLHKSGKLLDPAQRPHLAGALSSLIPTDSELVAWSQVLGALAQGGQAAIGLPAVRSFNEARKADPSRYRAETLKVAIPCLLPYKDLSKRSAPSGDPK